MIINPPAGPSGEMVHGHTTRPFRAQTNSSRQGQMVGRLEQTCLSLPCLTLYAIRNRRPARLVSSPYPQTIWVLAWSTVSQIPAQGFKLDRSIAPSCHGSLCGP